MTPDQITEAARAHFDKQRGQSVEVPEWGNDEGPAVVWFDPLTLRQRQSLQSRSGKSDARQMALTVILFAKDEKGAKIFKDDAPTLALFEGSFDPKIVARVALRILGLSDAETLGN